MSSSALRNWANSNEAKKVLIGFEFEMYFPETDNPDVEQMYDENDYSSDEPTDSIQDIIQFFSVINQPRILELEARLERKYQSWLDNVISSRSKFTTWATNETDIVQAFEEDAYDELDKNASEKEIQAYITTQIDWWVRENYKNDLSKYWDDFSSEIRKKYSEKDFLHDSGYKMMSDVERSFDYIRWPYTYGESSHDLLSSLEDWANAIERVVGMPVISGSYHGNVRKPNTWYLETDTSLEDSHSHFDAGLELISPPLPIPDAIKYFNKVVTWAKYNKLYTNRSTGLHMNMSVRGVNNVDWVKLVLFSGDEYILDQFDRSTNDYTTSSLFLLNKKIKREQKEKQVNEDDDEAIYRTRMNIDDALNKMRYGTIELAKKSIQSGLGQDKYQSIHIQEKNSGSYIEFRGPGNNWLDESSDLENNKILNTIYRLGRAMTIAADPNAERREYAKKLYKVLTPSDPSLVIPAKLFSQYSAGEISREQLKRQWAEAVLQDERKSYQQQAPGFRDYVIRDRKTGETLEQFSASGDMDADNYARNKYSGVDYEIKMVPNYKDVSPREIDRRQLAHKITSSPSWWKISVYPYPRSGGFIQAKTSSEAIENFLKDKMEFAGLPLDMFTAVPVKQPPDEEKT